MSFLSITHNKTFYECHKQHQRSGHDDHVFLPRLLRRFHPWNHSLATRSDCQRNRLCSFAKPVFRNAYLSFPRTHQKTITVVSMLQKKATMKKHSKPPGGPSGMPSSITLGSCMTNPTRDSTTEAPSPTGRQTSAVRSRMPCLLIWVNPILQRRLGMLSVTSSGHSPQKITSQVQPEVGMRLVLIRTHSTIRLPALR